MGHNASLFSIFVLFSLLSCNTDSKNKDLNPLVKVGDKVLFNSVIDQLVTEDTSPEDSASIVGGYVENWVRDNLVILEAEKNIPPDLNLSKLVDDYRSSLLMYHYENLLIKNQLDTIVTNEQKKDFYQSYGSQFILSHKIINPLLIKTGNKDKSAFKFKENFNKWETSQILEAAKRNNYTIIFNGNKWTTVDDVKIYLPKISAQNGKKGYKDHLIINPNQYFLKILGNYNENEIPPLEYIDDKIEQVILNNRKTALLKSVREQLYQKNINAKKIIYYQ
ncbi:MAG: hypothetical protein IPK25_19760 [Saprospiraceae bacterium]|nr:hypothetical protein [Saprospiraceae bacterium]